MECGGCIYVVHARCDDSASRKRLRTEERRLACTSSTSNRGARLLGASQKRMLLASCVIAQPSPCADPSLREQEELAGITSTASALMCTPPRKSADRRERLVHTLTTHIATTDDEEDAELQLLLSASTASVHDEEQEDSASDERSSADSDGDGTALQDACMEQAVILLRRSLRGMGMGAGAAVPRHLQFPRPTPTRSLCVSAASEVL